MRTIKIIGSLVLVLAAAACGGEGAPSGGAGTSKPAGSSAPAGATAAAAAASSIDLSSGGAEFAGLSVMGAAGAKAASDGAGGVSVAFGNYQVSVTPGKPAIADMKSGAKAGAEAVQGKITFIKDTAEELEYTTELKDVTGKDVKTHGFAVTLKVGGKTYGCSCADATNADDLAKAKAVCQSLAKK